MKSSKPPLPRSPIVLRSRRVLRPPLHPSVPPPPPRATSRTTKKPAEKASQSPAEKSTEKERKVESDDGVHSRQKYMSISDELHELEELVRQQLGSSRQSLGITTARTSSGIGGGRRRTLPLLEKGRFYNEYSALRDERIRKRKIEESKMAESSPVYHEQTIPPPNRTKSKKLQESAEKSQKSSRYSLRSSSKIGKKTPLQPLQMNINGSSAVIDRKIRKVRKL